MYLYTTTRLEERSPQFTPNSSLSIINTPQSTPTPTRTSYVNATTTTTPTSRILSKSSYATGTRPIYSYSYSYISTRTRYPTSTPTASNSSSKDGLPTAIGIAIPLVGIFLILVIVTVITRAIRWRRMKFQLRQSPIPQSDSDIGRANSPSSFIPPQCTEIIQPLAITQGTLPEYRNRFSIGQSGFTRPVIREIPTAFTFATPARTRVRRSPETNALPRYQMEEEGTILPPTYEEALRGSG